MVHPQFAPGGGLDAPAALQYGFAGFVQQEEVALGRQVFGLGPGEGLRQRQAGQVGEQAGEVGDYPIAAVAYHDAHHRALRDALGRQCGA
ncbi:hypothetical protein ABI924_02785 [Chromobacterium phragmitis]